MLAVYFGNDDTSVRAAALKALQKLSGTVTKITPEMYEMGMIGGIAEGASLFGDTQIFFLDTLSESGEEVLEDVFEHLEAMKESVHHFIIVERKLDAASKKRIEKYGEVSDLSGEGNERFNTFSLTDALLSRDKKSLWLLLQEALRRGHTHEELIGILFWQLKTMRLVDASGGAEEAGLKPFVYSKAKRALPSFKKGELESLSSRLLSVYHEGHMGKRDTGLALEAWVLSL